MQLKDYIKEALKEIKGKEKKSRIKISSLKPFVQYAKGH